jgi:mannosyltransferase OCH1-like enzyme
LTIPRIIHQTARDYDDLPEEIRQNIQHVKSLNPGWEHRFYSDSDIFEYIERHFDRQILQASRRINPCYGVVLADLFRYLVSFREGGVYLDAKSSLTRPLDEVLLENDVYLLSQWDNRLGRPFHGWGHFPETSRIAGGEFQQWHIVAAPGHPFLHRVITEVLFNMQQYHPRWFGVGQEGVVRVSGPICYSLSIAPMLPLHQFRPVAIEELGFRYTIYDSIKQHIEFGKHYTRCDEPIMLPG